MSTRPPLRDTSLTDALSLWHGLAANWHSQVTQQILDTAEASIRHSLALQRDLTGARTLTDMAAAHGSAARRMVETMVGGTHALSALSASMGKELAATLRQPAEGPSPAE